MSESGKLINQQIGWYILVEFSTIDILFWKYNCETIATLIIAIGDSEMHLDHF